MIKDTDLRKGNAVIINNEIVFIQTIEPWGVSVKTFDGGILASNYTYEQIIPIILSSDIFEQCGLIRGVNDEYFIGRINLRPSDDWWEIYLQGNDTRFHWIGNLIFLHNLQNFMYALTGTELSVNLKEKV